MARLVGERALQPALLADVVEHHDHADQPSTAIADRRRRVLDRDLDAAAVDEQRLLGQLDHAPLAQAADDRVLDRLAARLVDQVDDLADRTARGLGRIPAGELLGDGVQVLDTPFGVGGDDGVADRLQRDLGLLLFLEQLDLGALALRDVRDRALVADDLSVLVADQARVLDYGDDVPVAPAQLVLGVAHYAVAHQTGHHCVAVRGIHIQFARRGQGEQVVRALVAEHPTSAGLTDSSRPSPVAR